MVKSRKTCSFCKSCGDVNLTYHRFPSNVEKLKVWCDALGLNWKNLPKYAYVCSKHFSADEFIIGSHRINILKHSVPKPLDMTKSLSATNDPGDCSSTDTANSSPSSRTLTVSETDDQRVTAIGNCSNRHNSPNSASSSTSSGTLTASEIENQSLESSPSPKRVVLGAIQAESLIFSHKRKPDNLFLLEGEKENIPENVSQKSKKRKLNIPRHFGDITSEHLDDSNMAKICWRIAKKTINMQRKKINNLQAQKRRRENKIFTLESLTADLKRRNLISENAQINLNNSISESTKQLFSCLLRKRTKQYPPELRKFALTLNFYSRKAYNYVRSTFCNVLPHTRTLSKWYANIDASPGFMQEALSALKIKCLDAAEKGNKILCNLVLDEMSIRKKIEWDGKKTYGYVDLGINTDNEDLEEAKEVLVFMLVSINSSWKVPVGYFLTNGLNSSEKANLVKNCLEFVHLSSVIVTSVTFDGAPSNIAMANALGANLGNMKTYFVHPSTSEKTYIFLDPCHMIKLIRNSFGSQKMLEDGNGNIISWDFLEKMCQFQENQELHAATKLRSRHMSWIREKMKVSLAVQTLSKSVAEALDFLNIDLKISSFKNSEATATFCRNFNNLFDIFNSRNVLTKKPFEKPLSLATEKNYFEYMDYCTQYIKNLRIENVNILKTKKKTGFLGFLVCIESLKQLYTDRVKNLQQLKYLLTYKLSQDHLEIFFSCIRSKGGYNNNPTSKQFQSIMKKLLIHSEISGSEKANAVALDSTAILHCSSVLPKVEINATMQELHNSNLYCTKANAWNLTLYCQDVIAYAAGFVARQLKKIVKCSSCLEIIESNETISKLQIRKTYGCLTKASQFVIEVCKHAEKYFRSYLHFFNVKGKKIDFVLKYIKIKAATNIPRHLVAYFSNHIFDDEPLTNHFNVMIDLIFEKYFLLRLHHEISQLTDKQERIRSVLTKTILFKNQ